MMNRRKTYRLVFLSITVLFLAGAIFAKRFHILDKRENVETSKEKFTDEDVKEVSSVFGKIDTANNLFMEGSYELYDNETKDLLETEPFILAKSNGDTYMKVGPIEEFMKGGSFVMIDNSTKTVLAQDSIARDTSFSIFKGFAEMKEVINEKNGFNVSITNTGGIKTIRFDGDSTEFYRTSEIVYETATRKLKMASVVTKVIMPGNEENAEKKVLLKMVLSKYEDNPVAGKHVELNNKIKWVNNKLELTDSLKNYQINYNK